MATAKYELLLGGMYHDGHDYVQGDVVELEKERGDHLVDLGALKPAAEKTARGRGKAEEPAPTVEG
jgi:hypothetical protein